MSFLRVHRRHIIWSLSVLMLLSVFFYLYTQPRSTVTFFENEHTKQAALEAVYKNDPYGGSTPEETLQLYIAALENDDIETAVNLFAVEDRESAKNSFEKAKFMKEYMSHLKLRHRFVKSASGVSEVGIEFFDIEKQVHYERMKLNQLSNKWKLIQK